MCQTNRKAFLGFVRTFADKPDDSDGKLEPELEIRIL